MSATSRRRTMLVEGPCAPRVGSALVVSMLPAPGAPLAPRPFASDLTTASDDKLLDDSLALIFGKRIPVAPPTVSAPPPLVPPPVEFAPPLPGESLDVPVVGLSPLIGAAMVAWA